MAEWIVEITDGLPHLKNMKPLVRCKDCEYGDAHEMGVKLRNAIRCNLHDDGYETHEPEWFCADGKVATVKNEDSKTSGDVK